MSQANSCIVIYMTDRCLVFEPHHENLIFAQCENKGADQLCSNCTADRRLCFRHKDSAIPLQACFCDCAGRFCRTWLMAFSCEGLLYIQFVRFEFLAIISDNWVFIVMSVSSCTIKCMCLAAVDKKLFLDLNVGMPCLLNCKNSRITSCLNIFTHLSRPMGKPICLGENKGADQLRSNCEADQRLCFRYSNSTVPMFYLNPKFQASSSFL